MSSPADDILKLQRVEDRDYWLASQAILAVKSIAEKSIQAINDHSKSPEIAQLIIQHKIEEAMKMLGHEAQE